MSGMLSLLLMNSWATSPAVRRNMQAIRRRDTKIEIAVRQRLHAKGLRFRVDFAPVNRRRRADIVFTRRRVAVFIDGCFWHHCPEHFVLPKSNVQYWAPKLAANASRSIETDEQLRRAGWLVLRFWEHDGADHIAEEVADLVATR